MPPQSTLDQALNDSHGRLHPSLSNPNWLILRQRREIFRAGLDRLPEGNLSVLDIGGRLQPYRPLLGSRVGKYLAADLTRSPLVDVVAAAEALPFRNEEFDFVICTQVLEYLADPGLAAAEIKRVLRSGGVAFFSAPAIFLRDHDREFWRFLPEGLRHILRDFEAVEVIPEGNSFTGLFRTLNVFLISFARPRMLAFVLGWTLVPLLNIAGNIMEKLGGKNDQFAANFSVWVRR
jgi:SAM-dependent methyltransferase